MCLFSIWLIDELVGLDDMNNGGEDVLGPPLMWRYDSTAR
jgi:hypothetical protein